MWKNIQYTCLGIFSLLLNFNGISGFSGEDNIAPAPTPSDAKLSGHFNEELENDFIDLEPGFDYTEAEMKKLKIWPGGIIPYYIDTLSFDAEFRKKLDSFINTVSKKAGVNFLKLQSPPSSEKTRWVFLINRRGLLTTDGYTTRDFTTEGVQRVVVGYDSPYNGELLATMLAILGVPPQHNAPNRDKYITIMYDNVLPDKKQKFDILKNDEWLFHDLDYDFLSAGHYGWHKFSVGGYATIEPKNTYIDGVGNGQRLSSTDIQKIRMMYNYISKFRLRNIQMSDCLKLFEPGTKCNKQVDKPIVEKPRPKPNKYLGKPDDKEKEKVKKTNNTNTEQAKTQSQATDKEEETEINDDES